MHDFSLDPFNLQSLSNSLIVSQIMATDVSLSSINVMNQDLVKLDCFDQTNITCWQDKLIFLLAALKIFSVLDLDLAPIPEPQDDDSEELNVERKKGKDGELLFPGHILNTLSNRLYDLYIDNQSTTKIWKALKIQFSC